MFLLTKFVAFCWLRQKNYTSALEILQRASENTSSKERYVIMSINIQQLITVAIDWMCCKGLHC